MKFLWWIVTGDKTWVHHYDPENKKSMEYHHKGSLAPKKFKTKASAKKVMLTVIWNSGGVVLTDFLGKGTIVNSECYTETLTNIKKHITRKGGRN